MKDVPLVEETVSGLAGMACSPAGWLQRGQSLESQCRFDEAVLAYDRAIASLRNAAATTSGRRVLGVCWMNRGNALQKVATPASLVGAVAAYDNAIGCFCTLPVAVEPVFRNHLGAAWLNRGHALIALARPEAAIEALERAIAELGELPLEADVSYRLNLAGAWTNLAHVFHASSPAQARAAARAALDVLASAESTRAELVEMGLRARRVLAAAVGELLVRAETAGQPVDALAEEAGDAIEGGLELARRAFENGRTFPAPLAVRLFRMGVQLYRMHQPHFLAEFVLENVGHPAFANEEEFHSIAREAIAAALAEISRPRLLIAGAPEAMRVLKTARSLRAAQQQLFANSASATHS